MGSYKLKFFDENDKKLYHRFLEENDHFLWYVSLEYKLLLESYLNVKSVYILVKKENEIIGCLPLMESCNFTFGNVLNSLPFYGSNGGFLIDKKYLIKEGTQIMNLLLKYLQSYINENNIGAITLITNPFNSYSKAFLEDNFNYTFSDFRIGQITPLPARSDDLLTMFENPRPRNIRKALKSGVTIRQSTSDEDFDFLVNTHQQNIQSIGGESKSKLFFDNIKKIIPKENYSIFIAEIKEKKVAALLLFYFNKTVEYFTPCSIYEYRKQQPTSLLIFEAMKDAIGKNYEYWNWGGTWQSQKGVYDFKKKWGANDMRYFYYTLLINKEIMTLSRDQLLKLYPNFYILPFNQLETNNEKN